MTSSVEWTNLDFKISVALPGMIARSDACPPGMRTVAGSILKIGHEIISMAILSFPLIQEGQLSVTGENMCTKYW